MLNQNLEGTLNLAYKIASERRHEFLTVEHLLLALLDNPDSVDVLRACGAKISRLRQNLINFIDETSPVVPDDVADRETQPQNRDCLIMLVINVQPSKIHDVFHSLFYKLNLVFLLNFDSA